MESFFAAFSARSTTMTGVVGSLASLLLVGLLGGCHTDLGLDSHAFECTESSECMDGWTCGAAGVCVRDGLEASDSGDLGAVDTAGDVDADVAGDAQDKTDAASDAEQLDASLDSSADTSDTSDDQDAGPECSPACSEDQICHPESLTCVGCASNLDCPANQECDSERDECMDVPCESADDCGAEQFCTGESGDPGVCLFDVCPVEGARCATDDQFQNEFECLDTDGGDPSIGVCETIVCFVEDTQSACPDGSYCVSDTDGDLSCRRSECSDDSDCSGGWCFQWSFNYGSCLDSGTVPKGSHCVPGDSTLTCEESLVCDVPDSGPGECKAICDPLAGSTIDACGSNSCYPISSSSGVCVSPPAKLGELERCSSTDAMCDDGLFCDRPPGLETSENHCLTLCDPGERMGSVCDSVGEPRDDFVCNSLWRAGERDIGVCTLACTSDDDCRNGWECSHSICRKPCLTDSDCGAGQLGQDFVCLGGYCE